MIGWEEEELPLSLCSAAQAITHARLRTSFVALRPAPSCPSLREHTYRYTSSSASPTASHTAV